MNKNALKLGIKRRDYNEEIADIECFMSGFKNWRIGRNVSFPAPKSEFVEELSEFMRDRWGVNMEDKLVFTKQKKVSIKFAWIEARSLYNQYDDITLKQKVMNEWYTFLKNHKSTTLGSPYVTGGDFDIFGL